MTKLNGVIFAGLTSMALLGCTATHHGSKEWEYKAVRLNSTQQDFETQLNAASAGGWRLVNVVPADGGANSGYSQYVFQRAKR
jgi:hypothetical protein